MDKKNRCTESEVHGAGAWYGRPVGAGGWVSADCGLPGAGVAGY